MFRIPSLALRIKPRVWGWAVGQHVRNALPTAPFPHAVKIRQLSRVRSGLSHTLSKEKKKKGLADTAPAESP